jgi:hypothetical protein
MKQKELLKERQTDRNKKETNKQSTEIVKKKR